MIDRSLVADVAGIPETELGPELLARLPENSAPPPWSASANVMQWLGRPTSGLADALTPGLRGRAKPVATLAAMLQYTGTPVGDYGEIMASPLVRMGARPHAHVPFIAVDSEASLVGGRINWALPKTLAEFDGDPIATGEMTARGEGWEVRASASSRGPAIPVFGRMTLMQEFPDGQLRHTLMKVRGRARAARVTVESSGGPELRALVPSGRFAGFVIEGAHGWFGHPKS